MTCNRRDFFRRTARGVAAAGAAGAGGAVATLATVAAPAAPAEAAALQRPPKPLPTNAVGLLYDSTLCIGCKACMTACKQANELPADIGEGQKAWNQGQWDTPVELSGRTINVIKAYTHGTMATKDAAIDGYAFLKRQCLHCADPSCVSVCPVSAMVKDPDLGVVRHHKERCIGCRYCVLSCPFGVPKYDFTTTWGQIRKCQMCIHRLEVGQLPACVDVCPTGATLFGRRQALLEEARRRLALKPGERAVFPRGDLTGTIEKRPRPDHEALVRVSYQPHVYGERELGGTQCMAVSAVPFDKLNLPTNVPDYGYPTLTEGIQETLYSGMAAPAAVLAGLLALTWRSAHFDPEHHGKLITDDGAPEAGQGADSVSKPESGRAP